VASAIEIWLSISNHYGNVYLQTELTNLINLGILKAKRIDPQTVLIEWDSVQRYLDSWPDVTCHE
jgi:hypothetical protein